MNPHFRKGGKSKQGAGHVWVLAQESGSTGDSSSGVGGSVTMNIIYIKYWDIQGHKLISNEREAVEAVRRILDKSRAERKTVESSMVVAGDNDLQRSAEQILSGVRRPTGVESSSVLDPVTTLDTGTGHNYEIMLQYQHQDAAITLSSLEQVSLRRTNARKYFKTLFPRLLSLPPQTSRLPSILISIKCKLSA